LAALDPYPLVLLGLGMVTILGLIIYFRVNAFLALIAAALLVGLLSPRVILTEDNHVALLNAPVRVTQAFGVMMGKIGLVIALATIIGRAMMDSGAAERVVRFFTDLFGERFSGLALLASGYILSVPVFFDTVFLLLVPLAKALYKQTKKNYLLYVTAIGAGGAVTHSLVPPTPGPVGMAAILKVDLGVTILVGFAVGVPLALIGYLWASFANRTWPVALAGVGAAHPGHIPPSPIHPTAAGYDPGIITDAPSGITDAPAKEEGMHDLRELPALWVSLVPILLPVLLITSSTIYNTITKNNPDWGGVHFGSYLLTPRGLLAFFGNPNIALLLSAAASMWIVASRVGMTRRQLGTFTAAALDDAGMILLITSAGGAFGTMLKEAGVGDSLQVLSHEFNLSLIVLAWFVAALFKIAQGSGTVSMITTAGIIMAILPAQLAPPGAPPVPEDQITGTMLAQHLGYHPVYLLLAIGCGSKIGSWMNDSGFWVVCKMGGLTEGETFRSWTLCLVSMGVAGLPIVWLLSKILPLV
jgi:GntP family gluconate:H+ symporter